MSKPSWQNSLRARLAKHPRKGEHETRPYRVAVLGIGNELRGDDAAGVIVARELNNARSGLQNPPLTDGFDTNATR